MMYEWETVARLAKPCPLCGSRNVVTEKRSKFEEIPTLKTCTYIECRDCHVTVYGDPVLEGTTYNEAQRRVLKRWNRRAS